MRKLFEGQGYHLLVFAGIGLLTYFAMLQFPEHDKSIWRLTVMAWFAVSWFGGGAHNAFGWFFWRLQLHYSAVTRLLGRAGFPLCIAGFLLLVVVRYLPLVPVAIATRGSLPVPQPVTLGLIVFTTPLILWCLYSVHRHFGFVRACGADHFDAKYRGSELEKRGIFRYMRNPLYAVGFLVFYHPGLLHQSAPALLLAAAHHALLWAHYFYTEKPDMREIYGDKAA